MANATTNLDLINIAYVNEQYPSTHYNISADTWYGLGRSYPYYRYIFAKLEAFPAAYKHNKLIGIQFKLQVERAPRLASFYVYQAEDYNANTVTWYTHPKFYNSGGEKVFYHRFEEVTTGDVTIPEAFYGTNTEPYTAYNVLKCTALCFDCLGYTYNIKTVLENSSPICAVVTYDDAVIVTSIITYKSGPKSGYANPRNDITFSWDYNPFGYCADPTWGQTSATFYWKTSADANYTAVSAGTTKSVTIPANTFPANDEISWYVTGTDDEGTTTTTPVYSFSTAASAIITTATAPLNTLEDGSAPITFRWQITSDDGQPASRTRVWWKLTTESESSWHVLADVNEAITSYIAPGGTLPAGEIQWKVQAFNVDDVEGAWSEGSFICAAAPHPVNGLAATSVPFSTITWQSGEQQAYQIIVDGNVIAKAFGADVYSYTLEEPLADGTHEITVIVQGIYGYWSQPSTVTVTIQNEPDATITLTGTFDIDATLEWDSNNGAIVYRDDARIAKTTDSVYVDRLTLGTHQYYVVERLDNGNYNRSNTVVGTLTVECGYIAPLSGGDWVKLEYSKLNPVQTYTKNRTVSAKHYCGSKYPVVEMSNFYNHSGSYSVLFQDKELAEQFKALLGDMVIVKSRQDIVIVGVFSQYDERVEDYFLDYDFIIQESDDLEDYINETDA